MYRTKKSKSEILNFFYEPPYYTFLAVLYYFVDNKKFNFDETGHIATDVLYEVFRFISPKFIVMSKTTKFLKLVGFSVHSLCETSRLASEFPLFYSAAADIFQSA